MKETKRYSTKKIVLTIIFGILGLILAAFVGYAIYVLIVFAKSDGGFFSGDEYYPLITAETDLSAVESNAEIKIPASATEIFAHTEGMNEISVFIRFNLPAEDLDEFIKSSACQEPLTKTKPNGELPSETMPDWWKPNIATELETCSGEIMHTEWGWSTYKVIYVDTSDPDQYIVYVSATN